MHGCARGPQPVGAVGWQVQSAPDCMNIIVDTRVISKTYNFSI